MSAESDQLRVLYPEFASTTDYTDATVDTFILYAQDELAQSVWGKLYLRGALALAAHMMAMAKRSTTAAGSTVGAPVGAISSLKTGQEQINYEATVRMGDASDLDASLRSTPYGLEYIRLREQVSGHPLVIC